MPKQGTRGVKRRLCDGQIQRRFLRPGVEATRPPIGTWNRWALGQLDPLREQALYSWVQQQLFVVDVDGSITPLLRGRMYEEGLWNALGAVWIGGTLRGIGEAISTEEHFYNSLAQLICSRLIDLWRKEQRLEKRLVDVSEVLGDPDASDVDMLPDGRSTPADVAAARIVLEALTSREFGEWLRRNAHQPFRPLRMALIDMTEGRREPALVLELLRPGVHDQELDGAPIDPDEKHRMRKLVLRFLANKGYAQ